jgi:glycosyltransferase involved in cell wall biosynthesis
MRPELSIVIPFLNEEEILPLLKQRFEQLQEMPETWEIIFVSDGSTDASLPYIEKWASDDIRVKLIVLTRNFGQQAAISAGLDHAEGNYVGIMDADLQDPPEVLLEMFKQARIGNWDIVYGVRSSRKESWSKRIAYKLFYFFYSFLADSPVKVDSGDFGILSRRAVRLLSSMPERLRFVRGLRSWMGLRQLGIPIDRPERQAGKAQYSFSKLIALAVTGITSFSIKPLRLATFLGILLCGLSMLGATAYLLAFLFTDVHQKVPGFFTIVILIFLMSGLQFLLLGVQGEYIGRIFWEVKQRPTYLVDYTVNCSKDSKEKESIQPAIRGE